VAFSKSNRYKTKGIHKQYFDGMITEKLLLAQAKLDSVEVKEEENYGCAGSADSQLCSSGRFGTACLSKCYGKSIARIKREYREDIKNQLLVQHVRQQHEENFRLTRREVEDFFATYKDSLPAVP